MKAPANYREFLAAVRRHVVPLQALVRSVLEAPATIEWVMMAGQLSAGLAVLERLLSFGEPESTTAFQWGALPKSARFYALKVWREDIGSLVKPLRCERLKYEGKEWEGDYEDSLGLRKVFERHNTTPGAELHIVSTLHARRIAPRWASSSGSSASEAGPARSRWTSCVSASTRRCASSSQLGVSC